MVLGFWGERLGARPNHCAEPACLPACPTGAMQKRAKEKADKAGKIA